MLAGSGGGGGGGGGQVVHSNALVNNNGAQLVHNNTHLSNNGSGQFHPQAQSISSGIRSSPNHHDTSRGQNANKSNVSGSNAPSPQGGASLNAIPNPRDDHSPRLGVNGVLFSLDEITRTASPTRLSSTASPTRLSTDSLVSTGVHHGPGARNGHANTNGSLGSLGPEARPGTTALADERPKDPKPQRLALLGLVVAFVGTLLALIAVCTSQWARAAGLAGGYLGPFMTCQDSYKGYSECSPHTAFQPAGAAVFAGVCSVLCCVLAVCCTVLSAAVYSMHASGQRVLLKYKYATVSRMVASAIAGLLSFIAMVAFVVEVQLVRGAAVSGGPSSYSLAWGFYVQVLATLVLWAAGGASSAEWQRSRKLGGDPTMVNRDSQGLHANTISNPHFKDDKQQIKTVSASVPPLVIRSTSPVSRNTSPDAPKAGSPIERCASPNARAQSPVVRVTPLGRSESPSIKSSTSSVRSMSPTGQKQNASKANVRKAQPILPTPLDVHRSNGVSGSQVNGLPYMLGIQRNSNGHTSSPGAQAKRSVFDFNNKIIKNKPPRGRSRSPNGRSSSARGTRSPKNVRKSQSKDDGLAFVPYDPNRAPLRSSLRKPRTQSESLSTDTTDGGAEEGGIPNLAFAQSSPVTKKKVRIHTQSTAV
ncbi:uncharacterized protein LOC108679754 [Hyalella azteca]|uniref:Uncharacterized protein LOC108679754 n=1 Tax=Hyalella azteca TaxID=294128 RepID=A0A8B7PF95_HYAAZ|nr:uncharacterized protein LOC108679754 [Hyalella azteca]